MAAKSADVLRQQSDGTWRFIIDIPWGTDQISRKIKYYTIPRMNTTLSSCLWKLRLETCVQSLSVCIWVLLEYI